jgi:hypothetical protein
MLPTLARRTPSLALSAPTLRQAHAGFVPSGVLPIELCTLNLVLCNGFFSMIEELKIYRDVSELIKRVFIIVKNFPRDYKFTLGTRIQNTALDCADLIYKSARHKEKYQYLDDLVSSLDFLSFLIRTGKDMNIVTERQYGLYIELSMPCVKQASGWLKSSSK